MKVKFLFLIITVAALSSCAHSLPYQSSQMNPPSTWSRLDAVLIPQNEAQVEQYWWKSFKDATLDQLVQEAVGNNKTLGIARARVEEALGNLEFGNASQLPDITGVVAPSRGNQGFATGYKPISLISAELQATWEIDVFGRNLPLLAQAQEMTQYAEANRQAVLVGLLAQLGQDYFQLQDYKLQIAITLKNLKNQKRTLELIKAQKQGAMASDFDVERAAAQVSTTESKLPVLKSAYDIMLDKINVLLGAAPGAKDSLIQTAGGWGPLDQHIIVSAPATVLANRPDVKAAERNFAMSISNKQYAQKQFFPDISLLSFYGVQGISHRIPAYPWYAGLTITQPIVDFGRIKSQINVARAQENEAFLNYQQTILQSLEDMEDALTNYKNEIARNISLRTSVDQNRRAAALAQQQFKSGFTGLLDLLTIQNNLLDAESALADSDCALRKDLVAIYAASGGGWQVN